MAPLPQGEGWVRVVQGFSGLRSPACRLQSLLLVLLPASRRQIIFSNFYLMI